MLVGLILFWLGFSFIFTSSILVVSWREFLLIIGDLTIAFFLVFSMALFLISNLMRCFSNLVASLRWADNSLIFFKCANCFSVGGFLTLGFLSLPLFPIPFLIGSCVILSTS